MRLYFVRACALAVSLMLLLSCSQETEEQRHREANTVAGKLGQAAHKAAVETDKAGRVIGKKLDKAAHDAKAGWEEDARKQRSK